MRCGCMLLARMCTLWDAYNSHKAWANDFRVHGVQNRDHYEASHTSNGEQALRNIYPLTHCQVQAFAGKARE